MAFIDAVASGRRAEESSSASLLFDFGTFNKRGKQTPRTRPQPCRHPSQGGCLRMLHHDILSCQPPNSKKFINYTNFGAPPRDSLLHHSAAKNSSMTPILGLFPACRKGRGEGAGLAEVPSPLKCSCALYSNGSLMSLSLFPATLSHH